MKGELWPGGQIGFDPMSSFRGQHQLLWGLSLGFCSVITWVPSRSKTSDRMGKGRNRLATGPIEHA